MQQLTTKYALTLCDDYILISFDDEFEQEDIDTLHANILSKIAESEEIEIMAGADRVSYRCQTQGFYWAMHFEIYSQSCWIEGEVDSEQAQLQNLFQLINNK